MKEPIICNADTSTQVNIRTRFGMKRIMPVIEKFVGFRGIVVDLNRYKGYLRATIEFDSTWLKNNGEVECQAYMKDWLSAKLGGTSGVTKVWF